MLGCFRVLGVGVVFFVIWFVVDVFKLIIGVAVSMMVEVAVDGCLLGVFGA